MNPERRLAYLEAMEIPVWVRRAPGEAPGLTIVSGLRLGPGNGSLLLLCRDAAESAEQIASDIARSIRIEPVWGWPDPDAEAHPEDAVADRLITDIVVFGALAEADLFGGPAPEVLGSAAVHRAPALSELTRDAGLRRALWQRLVKAGLAGPREAHG